MATKQYVNITGGDPANHEGRSVPLKINATETKPGASQNQPIFVFIKPGGKNEDVKWIRGNDRAEAFHTKPPHKLSGSIKDKKAEISANVGVCGGDTFDFEVGKKDDGSGKKSIPGQEVEVWRKIFFKVGHMKGVKTHGVMGLQGKFDPVFIELEQEGGDTEIPHESFIDSLPPIVSKLQALASKAKHGDQTLWIVCVDRIFDRGHKDIRISHDPTSFPKSKCFKAKFEKKVSGKTVQYYTWPDSNAWLMGGSIKLFDSKGALRADQPPGPYVFPIADGVHFRHPEGLLASTLGFDFTQFPGIDDWLKDDANKMTIDLEVHNLESSSAGMALDSGLVVAARNSKYAELDPIADGTVLHEMGHALGQVLRWIHSYTPDTADLDDKVQNGNWYTNVNGGVGNHCNTGSSLDANNKYKAGGKPCVMFHGTASNTTDFCGKCQEILKRARLTKLGRVSVWGNSGWA